MGIAELVAIGLFLMGGIFSILWWLLRNKDAAQADQIKILFTKHDDDAKRLQDLELDIARRHYVKDELDTKFDKIEETFNKGFASLGSKFDKLSETLIDHMRKEDAK